MRADTADAPELNDRGQEQSFLYDAFLSYDHDDRPVAPGIHRGLHRIGRRVGRLHALRVFRDSTDLSANPDLWGKVTEAMDRYTEADARGYFAEQEQGRVRGEELNFAFVEPADDDVVLGGGSLYDVGLEQSHAAVGYWLAPEARGRGVATYAVRLLARPIAVTPGRPGAAGAARCGRITSILRSFLSMWVGYEPSVQSGSVRSWKVVSVRGSSPPQQGGLTHLGSHCEAVGMPQLDYLLGVRARPRPLMVWRPCWRRSRRISSS